jgi:hypothetical protein
VYAHTLDAKQLEIVMNAVIAESSLRILMPKLLAATPVQKLALQPLVDRLLAVLKGSQ